MRALGGQVQSLLQEKILVLLTPKLLKRQIKLELGLPCVMIPVSRIHQLNNSMSHPPITILLSNRHLSLLELDEASDHRVLRQPQARKLQPWEGCCRGRRRKEGEACKEETKPCRWRSLEVKCSNSLKLIKAHVPFLVTPNLRVLSSSPVGHHWQITLNVGIKLSI